MLLLFWLPILLSKCLFCSNFLMLIFVAVSILWAFHNGARIAFQAVRVAVKTPLRA